MQNKMQEWVNVLKNPPKPKTVLMIIKERERETQMDKCEKLCL